jgi:methyl-accepting chemotaxis protein
MTLSQLSVAAIIVYAGLAVGTHMESWSESFKRGSEDLSSIRGNMNTIAYSMESINKDMDYMKLQADDIVKVASNMEIHVHELKNEISIMTQQMQRINDSVGGIQRSFSPRGMMNGFMPF